jgi:hypothetical protein
VSDTWGTNLKRQRPLRLGQCIELPFLVAVFFAGVGIGEKGQIGDDLSRAGGQQLLAILVVALSKVEPWTELKT